MDTGLPEITETVLVKPPQKVKGGAQPLPQSQANPTVLSPEVSIMNVMEEKEKEVGDTEGEGDWAPGDLR